MSTFPVMRFSTVATLVVMLFAVRSISAQRPLVSPLKQLEREMLARVAQRAIDGGGFRLGGGEFDLRIPMKGEPEEIIGPTLNASEALAIGSARVEPLEAVDSRDSTFRRARYAFRLEDRQGNCLIVHQVVTFDTAATHGARSAERCQPLYMAEVVRRNRRIARIPLNAGRLDDHWSAALAATGTADVYLDSVVITTTTIAIRAAYPVPATEPVVIDSVDAGLASGESGWSVVRHSAAIRVDTTLRQSGEWKRNAKRFTIPIDPSFDLEKSWPVFQVYLSVPKTAENPYGSAWTYAHERKVFFTGLTERKQKRPPF